MSFGSSKSPKTPAPPAQPAPPPAPADAVEEARAELEKSRPKFGRKQTILTPTDQALSTILGTPIR